MNIMERALRAYEAELEEQRRESERIRQRMIESEKDKLRAMLLQRLDLDIRTDEITVPDDFPSYPVFVTIRESDDEVILSSFRASPMDPDHLYARVRCHRCGKEFVGLADSLSELGWLVSQLLEHERICPKQTNAPARG